MARTCAKNVRGSDSKTSYKLETSAKSKIWKTEKKLTRRHKQGNTGNAGI